MQSHLAKFKPDVVLLTQGASYDVLAEGRLLSWLRRRKTPVVVICHNSDEQSPLRPADIEIVVGFFDQCAQVLFVSSHNRRSAEARLGVTIPRTSIVQNPLAVSVDMPAAWPDSSDVARLGLVGRLDMRQKGIDMLLEALGTIQTEFKFSLTLTGRVENRGELEGAIAANKLQDRVRVTSELSGTALMGAYANLELFMLPSRYEGCSSAMIESLMCGRPVLATLVGGVEDWLEEGLTGYVSPGTTEGLCRTLRCALSEQGRWREMGVLARRAFELRRDPDPVGTLQRHVEQALAS